MPQLRHGESEAERRVLRGFRLAVELSAVILLVEAVGVYLSHSLSLAVDALHNVPDILAFAVSWAALRGTSSGASREFTFGTHRFEVLAGLLNGLLVCATGIGFGYEAVVNLRAGSHWLGSVDAIWLLAAAIPILALRGLNLRLLVGLPGRARDLNLRSVIVHLASDVAITGALLAAGALLVLDPSLGWADPGAALAISAILVYEGIPLLRDGWDVLAERAPRGVTPEAIAKAALSVRGVTEIHDVHVWSVCSSLVCLTAHVGVVDMTLHESMDVIDRLRGSMEKEFGILHATFEVECAEPHPPARHAHPAV